MNSIFRINTFFFLIFVLVFHISYSQENSDEIPHNENKKVKINQLQKLGFIAFDYSQPIPTGDNFVGKAYNGEGGFNFKTQFFIYEHAFLSGTVGANYFSVIDKSIVGNYNKTTASHQFISVGYEFLPLPKTRLGLSIMLFGSSYYKNFSMTNTSVAYQNDSGRIKGFDLYFDYMLLEYIAVYLNYSYRNDNMNIQSAPEIQSIFDKASFHNIGIGLKIYFGQTDVISGFN